jgi:FkbM family methyltransferase
LACNPDNASHCFAIDVGAHYGEFARFLLSTGFFNRVVSFEPNPESYLKLLNEVSRTAVCDYEAINSALSSKSGALDLFCDEDTATASLLKYDTGYLNQGAINKHTVPVFTLDEYLIDNPVDGKLQLLKIDTQGNDLSVIKGGAQTISSHRPIIHTEFIYIPLYEGQCSPVELSEALFSLDYEMYSLNNLHVTPEGRLAFCDAIFIPKELDIPVTQKYSCIDDLVSFQTQIQTLTKICAERLTVIELLNAEVQRLNQIQVNSNEPKTLLGRIKSWVQ